MLNAETARPKYDYGIVSLEELFDTQAVMG